MRLRGRERGALRAVCLSPSTALLGSRVVAAQDAGAARADEGSPVPEAAESTASGGGRAITLESSVAF